MKSFSAILTLVFLCQLIYAQTQTIDSLTRALKAAKEDTSRAKVLNNLSWALINAGEYDLSIKHSEEALTAVKKYSPDEKSAQAYNNIGVALWNQGNLDDAINYHLKALKIREDIGFTAGVATSYNNMALVYEYKGDYKQALKQHFHALKIRRKINNKKGIGQSLNNIASAYWHQSDYPSALKYCFESLKLYEVTGDKRVAANTYNNLGLIYSGQKNNKEALKNHFVALKLREELGEKAGVAGSLNNIGIVYQDQKKYAAALDFYLRAHKIREEIGDKRGLSTVYNNMGLVYFHQGNYEEALKVDLKALELRKEIGDLHGVAGSHTNIGIVYAHMKQWAKARIYLEEGVRLSLLHGDKEQLVEAYGGLSDFEEVIGDHKNAFAHYVTFIKYRDSLNSEENTRKAVQAEMQYAFDKKESASKLEQEKKDVIQREEAQRQKTVRNSFIFGFVLMLLLALVVYRNYRQKQKANDLLTRQKQEIQQKNEELNQQNEEIATQRDEIENQKQKVEEHQKEMVDSITYAKRLQDAILPPVTFWRQQLAESFILYKPKDIVAGDFYWMETTQDHVLFAAADCTGHGVPGAMVSVVCSNALNRTVKEFKLTEPGKILDKVRELVIETFERSESDVKDGMDISLCCLDKTTKQLSWAGANNPLWLIREGALVQIKADKQPIGKYADQKVFTTHTLSLNRGDTIYVFTDGYADQFGGPKGKKYKYMQLQELLLSNAHLSLSEQMEILEQKFEEWKGDLKQVDDVCVIGVRV